MTQQEWENLFRNALTSLRRSGIIPRDTGRMADISIRTIWVSDKTFKIYIDEDIAPYAKYTIEYRPNNPNNGWLERAVKYLAQYIEKELRRMFE